MEMVYGKVFVAGGAKGVGRAVIDKLVEQGSEVVALVRREDAKAELDALKGERDDVWRIQVGGGSSFPSGSGACCI